MKDQMTDCSKPISGIYTSQQGVEIKISRHPTPDGNGDISTLMIQYGNRIQPGTAVYLPDVPRCWPRAMRVFENFCNDLDSLGKQFRKAPPGRPMKAAPDGELPISGILSAGEPCKGSDALKEDIEQAESTFPVS